MSDLLEPPNHFDGFRKGSSEAFRHYFYLHHYNIYCYLLALIRDNRLARELTKNVFIVLIRMKAQVKKEEHLLECLYLLARIANLLHLRQKWSAQDRLKNLHSFPSTTQQSWMIRTWSAMRR